MKKPAQDNLDFDYKYGFSMPDTSVVRIPKGINEDIVRQISALKNEPQWMTDLRVKSYKIFFRKTDA
jgi:Fe-S cluster assembly protein SufB